MTQNLIQLPKEALFEVGKRLITIMDHKVMNRWGLLDTILLIVRSFDSDRQTLYQFEEHKVSFEAAIEYCAAELEHDTDALFCVVYGKYAIQNIRGLGIDKTYYLIEDFSKSVAGRKIAEQLIEKIRSCDNWGELYDEMLYTSKFTKDMRKRMIKELKEQNRIKKEEIK